MPSPSKSNSPSSLTVGDEVAFSEVVQLIDTHLFVRASVLILASFFGGLAVHAQPVAAPAPGPKFSVASVRPGDPSVVRGGFEYRPEAGEFDSYCVTLDRLIGFAYDVRAHQSWGGQNGWTPCHLRLIRKPKTRFPPGPLEVRRIVRLHNK